MKYKTNWLTVMFLKNRNKLLISFSILLIGYFSFLKFGLGTIEGTPIKVEEKAKASSPEEEPETTFLGELQKLMYIKPDSARYLANKQLVEIKGKGSPDESIPYLNVIGISHIYQGHYNKALENFHQTLELSIGDKNSNHQAYAFNNIGVVLLLTKNYKDALDYFFKSYDITKALGDTINQSRSLNNIGQIYLEIDDLGSAISYLNQAEQNFFSHNHKTGISFVSNNKAQYFLKKGKLDSSEYYFRRAIELGKESGNNRGLSLFYFEKGNFFLELEDHPSAIHYYQKSDSLSEILMCNLRSCFAHLGIAKAYLEKGEAAQSNLYVKKALEINEQLESRELQYLINEVLSAIYQERGNYYKAFEHYKLAKEQKGVLFDQAEIYQVYSIEIDQLTRKMELKEMEMEKQELLLGKRKNTMYLIVVASVSLLIILSMLYYFYINKVKQHQKEKLHENQIKHSYEKNKAVMEAEINERKRIGSDLHDGIGTLLSLTKLNMTNVLRKNYLPEQKKNTLLLNSVNSIDEVINEVKSISNSMTPIVLAEKGFKEAIKELVGKINSFSVNLSFHGLSEPLEPFMEHALYRTVQEALNNIAKHASCTKVNIQVLKNQKEITLMIEDNGKGFDMNNPDNKKGLGLKNASSRIESLNGQFFIDSKEGRGTIINIILPL